MYSHQLGRFLQRDPAGFVDGFNLYAYVSNNPLLFTAPYGLSPWYVGLPGGIAILTNDIANATVDGISLAIGGYAAIIRHPIEVGLGFYPDVITANANAIGTFVTSNIDRNANRINTQIQGGASEFGAVASTFSMSVGDFVGFTPLFEGFTSTDLETGKTLSGSESFSRASIGGGQLILSGVAFGSTLDSNFQSFRLNQTFLDDKIQGGGSFLMTELQFVRFARGNNVIGRSDGQFMLTSREMNRIISETGGDSFELARLTGNPNLAGQQLIRMDVADPFRFNARFPSSGFSGANPQFIPGRRTSGGLLEFVTDPIPGNLVFDTPVNLTLASPPSLTSQLLSFRVGDALTLTATTNIFNQNELFSQNSVGTSGNSGFQLGLEFASLFFDHNSILNENVEFNSSLTNFSSGGSTGSGLNLGVPFSSLPGFGSNFSLDAGGGQSASFIDSNRITSRNARSILGRSIFSGGSITPRPIDVIQRLFR